MRLFEIFNPETKPSMSSSRSYISALGKNTSSKKIGSGEYASVFQSDSPKRQGEVTKVGHNTFRLVDGYEEYIKAIKDYENRGGQNPYFPRVLSYSAKKSRGENGRFFTAQLEKLYDIRTPKIFGNEDLMEAVYNKMFTPEFQGKNAGQEIISNIRKCVKGGVGIKDPQLKEALDLIGGIVKSNPERLGYDLHGGNIMWRITGNMPQLVITDPISEPEESDDWL